MKYLVFCFVTTTYVSVAQVSDSLLFEVYFKKSEQFKHQAEKLDSAFYWADLMLKKAETPYQVALANYAKGEVIASNHWTYNTGEYAFEYYVKAINGFIQTKQRERLHHSLNALALSYERLYNPNNQFYSSKSLLYTAMAFRLQHDYRYEVPLPFTATIDDKPATAREIREAIKVTKDNIAFWETGNSPPHIMWRKHTLGKLYWELDKNMSNAETYFVQSATIAQQINDQFFYSICIGSLSVYHNQAQDYPKAILYSERGLQHATQTLKMDFREAIFRDQLYIAYKATGQMDKAIFNKEKALVIAERVYRESEAKGVSLMKERNAALQKQMTLEHQVNEQQRNQLWYFLGGFILVLLSAYFFYNNYQLRQTNRAISAALLEGQTTERQRLAADLHDNLGSTLSALHWSMEAINPQKLSPQEQRVYRHVQATITQAHDQVRLLSHNLLPDELQKQGLWKALQHLTDKLNRNTPLRWSLTPPDNPPRFDAKTEFELYSIVLELTNNILKHAQATEGRVECRVLNGECRVTVSDNGVGMAEKRVNGKGMQSVESRVRSLNGTLSITSQVGHGTTFEVVIDSQS
jgi:signal transduction histidine kinase